MAVGLSESMMPARWVSILPFTISASGVSANCTPMPAARPPCAPVGVIHTTLPATGTVASRYFVSALARRFGDLRTMCMAIWCWAVSIGGLALTGMPVVAVAMYGALGVGTGLWWAVNTTVRQQITPPRLRGRMNAAYRTVSWGVVPIGAAFGGIAAKWWGLRAPFVIGAVAMVCIALAAPRYLRPVRDALG